MPPEMRMRPDHAASPGLTMNNAAVDTRPKNFFRDYGRGLYESHATMTTRIAAPGAKRLKLNGVVAVSDCFNRVRLMIHDNFPDGKTDPTSYRLWTIKDDNAPYELRTEEVLPPFADGVRGTCWLTVPQLHRAHWLTVATDLRGKWATAEVTVRRYRFRGDDGASHVGVALDLCMLEPRSG